MDHSFYNLALDKKPTKKRCQAKKTPPKDKCPVHEEHQDRPPSASPTIKLPPFSLSEDDPKPHPITSLASAILLLPLGLLQILNGLDVKLSI
ncbi:hypothetical protein DSO57_1010909 [Entomophthora muscae]|uniref:Uncharacterized protein n=1 Tax=Entomophthora muscae TaxID=34485 RepID=A0ACC2U5V1_9FUNG|nr:hypothetical protein DSO57_1010909 [Entomophthora muscae]